MHLEGLVTLLLLLDPHQVVLCALLQHLLILERDAWRTSGDLAHLWQWVGRASHGIHAEAPLTFLKPSRTPFMFSYLLKRSAKERSTELRSAMAWSLSAVNCRTDLLQDSDFCCCWSSVNSRQVKIQHLKGEMDVYILIDRLKSKANQIMWFHH